MYRPVTTHQADRWEREVFLAAADLLAVGRDLAHLRDHTRERRTVSAQLHLRRAIKAASKLLENLPASEYVESMRK